MSTLDIFYCISRVLLSSVRNGVWILISWKKNFVAVLIKTLHIPIYRFVPLLVCLGFLSKTYQTRTLKHELRVKAEDRGVNQCAQEHVFQTFFVILHHSFDLLLSFW